MFPHFFPSIFPTHVGLFQTLMKLKSKDFSIPHASGGVPKLGFDFSVMHEYFPRKWGCSGSRNDRGEGKNVFPTHVGVNQLIFKISTLL